MFAKKFENKSVKRNAKKERGAALAIAIITVAILAVVALTALAFSSTEARIAGSDLRRTQTFYAASAGMEKMTNDFSALFQKKLSPTQTDLDTIEQAYPAPLLAEGFTFNQNLDEDTARLTEMRATQGLSNTVYPRINIPDGPYAGLYASIIPYKMSSTATMNVSGTQVKLEREFNNYLVPLFQFGMFSNEDIEIHPGPWMTFNGRIHSNGNVYALRNTMFLNRVTMAGEMVRAATRGGEVNNATGSNNVWFQVNGINVQSNNGSVQPGSGTVGGPNFIGSKVGQRGYFPGSPNGVANPNWETESVKPAAAGTADRFGGQVLTRTTGATALKLPLELGGYSPAEIIKRSLPSDDDIMKASRYHSKAQIRILVDTYNALNGASNVAGIPAGKGVTLLNTTAGFNPLPLGNGKVLERIDDVTKTYVIGDSLCDQIDDKGKKQTAMTVRGIKNIPDFTPGKDYIPPGSGIQAKILIEVVKPDGTTVDVTKEILSMGMTEGEPNGIVYLQRPLWAAFVQGSRDRSGNGLNLEDLTNNSQTAVDGEIIDPIPSSYFAANRNFISTSPTNLKDDGGSGKPNREALPIGTFNQIVPINVYNVREGWVRSTMSEKNVYYERGMTSVIELNMKNLARWLDGIYDTNLLMGTNAVSTNVRGTEGYVVYVSDRRGDRVNPEYLPDGTSYASTNGIVDNEDIYGPNGTLDDGEDVIDFGWDASKGAASKKGTMQKDILELPDTGSCWSVDPASFGCSVSPDRLTLGKKAMSYPVTYFRRAVRLFNGEKLSISAAAGKLSPTKGISVSSENMVYIWGNYNTTGITGLPVNGSTLNDGGYTGAQVPASIVCDAFFPLSKTWYDGLSAMYPEGSATPRTLNGDNFRMADENLPTDSDGTSVRAGVIAGTTISSLTATPGRGASGLRRNGGIINYPRFLELWNLNGVTRSWNYTGSFVPLFRSTQALSQWENDTSVIYMPPRRNWSFDQTFLSPDKLPPGTPFFQYVQATGFRQALR
ncbi:MAG: pilus assembly PilX N-terminal domain-containing protein [Acidobacteriota bacterium]|nr:pilus assembly PilX N-terminal domain-containing protein [Acidobacteriota bacterium]